MNMELLVQIVRIVESVVKVAGLLLGGWWTYKLFIKREDHIWSLDMSASATVRPLDDRRSLVTFSVTLKNIGKIVIIPGTEGLSFGVRRMDTSDGGMLPRWSDCEEVIPTLDLLEEYKPAGAKRFSYEMYAIGVGATYVERVSFVVPSDGFYLAKATFSVQDTRHWRDDNDGITEELLIDARHTTPAAR